MRKSVKRALGLSALAGLGYAAWRSYSRARSAGAGAVTPGLNWEPQPFPYPPQPVQTVSLARIAIAWNGAAGAVRAVHAALPLLRQANEVLLLRGAPKETFQEVSWKPPFDVDAYLDRHGIHVRSRDLLTHERDAGEALLEQADRFHADLLVMGAYGRSRFSEWALGGATRHVLSNARLPVLLRY